MKCSSLAQLLLCYVSLAKVGSQVKSAVVDGAGGWKGLDKHALEGCLGVAALALGVVMAGTGHLPTLKLLRGITPCSELTLS